jgi:GGDEF domain-containing protein
LQASFQDGAAEGATINAPSLWGIVLRIDRLHALHAQHGQATADAAFAITARLVQGHAPQPLAVARIGYGELLVHLVGTDEASARAKATELVRLVRDQPWEPPLTKITLTAGIGEKRAEESAGVWVSRIRAGLPSPGADHSSPASTG